jgi:hypothetical protein
MSPTVRVDSGPAIADCMAATSGLRPMMIAEECDEDWRPEDHHRPREGGA